MSKIELTSVTLSEVLEVRGGPLLESEIWSIFAKAVFALQDVCLHGELCRNEEQFITPNSLEFRPNGLVVLRHNRIDERPLLRKEFSEHGETSPSICGMHYEKKYIESLGKTLTYAMDFATDFQKQSIQRFSTELLIVVKSMLVSDVEERASLISLFELVNRVAKCKTNGKPFSYYIINMHTEVLGSVVEIAKLMQINCCPAAQVEEENCNVIDRTSVEIDASCKSNPTMGIDKRLIKPNSNASCTLSEPERVSGTATIPPPKNFVDHPGPTGTSGHISLQSAKEVQDQNILCESNMNKSEFDDKISACETCDKLPAIKPDDGIEKHENSNIQPDTTISSLPVRAKSLCQSRCKEDERQSDMKNCVGPEFVNRSYLPSIKLHPRNKKCPLSLSNSKAVTVISLTGQRFIIDCNLETDSASDILSLVIEHENLRETFLFGLACIKDGEFLFLEHYDKLSKMLSTRVRQNQNGGLVIDTLTLYLRVKFYVNTIFLRHSTTKDMFYLQLRRDVLENRISCNLSASMLLASFAMQAEYGESDSAEDVTLGYYLPLSVLEKNDILDIRNQLKKLRESHRGLSIEAAKEHFLNKVQTLKDYGFHFHKIFRNKKDFDSGISIGISLHGISLFDKRMMEDGCKLELQRFLWVNILRIRSDKRHFYVSLQHRNLKSHLQKYRFYTADNMGKYLFNLATSHHRLHLRLVAQSEDNFGIFPEREHNNNEKDYELLLQTSVVEKRTRSRESPKVPKRKLFRVSPQLKLNRGKTTPVERKKSPFKSKLLNTILRKQFDHQGTGKQGDDLEMDISGLNSSSPNNDAVFIDTDLHSPCTLFHHPEETINASLAERFTNLTGIEKSNERQITRVYLDRDSQKNSLGIKVCEGTDGSTYIQTVDSQNASLNIIPGDRIVAINGKYIENLGYPEVVDLIRSTVGSVQFLLSRAIQQEPRLTLNMDATNPPESIFIQNYSVMSLSNSTPCSYMKNNAELILSDEAMWDSSDQKGNENYGRKRIEMRDPGGCLQDDFDKAASRLKYAPSNAMSIESKRAEEDAISSDLSEFVQLSFAEEGCRNLEKLFGDGHPLTLNNTETNPSGKATVFPASCSPIMSLSEHEIPETMNPRESRQIFHVVLEKVEGDLGIKLMSRHGCTREGPVVIESLTKQGAAHRDGRIRAGDTIIEIGGVNVCGLPHCEVIGLLRGGPQVIHLALQRNSPAPQRSAFWNPLESPPVPPRPLSIQQDSSSDGTETDYSCCHLPVLTSSDSDFENMVSKLNKSSEDVSEHPMTPDSDENSPKTVLWQPKISGSVKNRISNIEAHRQPSPPSWIPRQPLLQPSSLPKKLISQSSLDLSSQYSSIAPKMKFATKFPSMQEHVILFENAEAQAPPPLSLRDGKWCPAVVSKPYRPSSAPCLPKLMRSKTLPAVYVPPPKAAPTSDSTEEVQNYAPESPPPWLAHLKSKGLQQRPPWWSRTNSVDATGGAGYPMPKVGLTSPTLSKKVPITSPTLNKKVPTTSPILNKKVPVTSPTLNKKVPTTSPILNKKVPTTSPILNKKIPTISPTLSKRVPTTPPPSKLPHSPPVFPPMKKIVSPMKSSEFQKFPIFSNFDTTDGRSAKPVPQTNGILKSVKTPRSPGHQTTKNVSTASSSFLSKSAPIQLPLRGDPKLEELHRQFNFVKEDTIFDVPLTKNTRGLGIRIGGGRDQDPDDCYTVFIRVKRLYPLQPAIECGKLEVGDIILTVNGRHLTGLKHSEAVDVLRVSPSNVVLLICRPLPNILPPVPLDNSYVNNGIVHKSASFSYLSLNKDAELRQQPAFKDFEIVLGKVNGSLGFTLHKKDEYHRNHGHFIKALVKDPALTDGRLQPGDQILKVNGTDIGNMSHTDAISFLRTCSNTVTLTIRRANTVVYSPLSPISPVVAFFPQDASNNIRQEKKILRKEAQDLLSDNNRRRNGELGPTSYEATKSLLRRRKLNGSPSSLSADSATSDTAENFSSDAESLRSSPTPTNGIPVNSALYKQESFTEMPPAISRDSSHSSLSNCGTTPLFKVPRPSFLSLTKQPSTLARTVNNVSPSESLSDSGQGHVPSLRVSKYESEGTTPSTEDTDSDSSGAVMPPLQHAALQESVQKINGPLMQNGGSARFHSSDTRTPDSPKSFQKLQFLATSDDDAKTGLRKWRGTVLSPVKTPKEEIKMEPPATEQVQQDLFTVELDRIWNSRLGFSLVAVEIGKLKGSFIRTINPGGLASHDGRLRPGDKILKINGISIENTQTDDVIEMLRKLHGKIILDVVRNPIVTNAVLNILRLQSI